MGNLKVITSNFLSLIRKKTSPQTVSINADDAKVIPKAGKEIKLPQKPTSAEKAIQVTDEFQQALSSIKTNKQTVFVTGQAGTGKSTFIRYLKENIGIVAPVLAPTGVAALNVNGQTIHSFFHIPPRITLPDEIKPLRNRRLFEELKLLIIDEISMVRSDLMDLIDTSLRINTGKEELPFGGVQIVTVGDLYQLPPVIASQTEARYIHQHYKTPYFLSSSCIQNARPSIFELTKVFRQQDNHFIELLSNLREGNNIVETVSEFNRECFFGDLEENDTIILTPENSSAGRINHIRLSKLEGPEKEYEGVITGQFNIETERLPAPKLLKLKVGARVMFTKNDLSHRWVNGTLGTVKEIQPKFIVVDVNDTTFTVSRETWESIRYDYDEEKNRIVSNVIGTYTQFPLMLAWAITIHKSQGKTFDQVRIEINRGAFAEGQLYVALSRCRTLGGISLIRPLQTQDVIVNPVVKEFYDNLRKNLAIK
jgi:ATP-dependent exoDNAse (exonuclease V) alpha subunit